MTDLLAHSRSRVPAADAAEHPRPLVLTASLAACWAAGVGLLSCVCVAVVGGFAGSPGGVVDAVRVGAIGWLLGQGGELQAGSATITAIPLGLTVLSAVLLWRSGRWAAWQARVVDLRGVAFGTATVAAVFATTATATALLTSTDSADVSPTRMFVSAALLASLSACLGMLRGADLLGVVAEWLPQEARAALRGGVAGVAAILAGGVLLVTVSLATDFRAAADVTHAMGAGAVGGAIFTLVGVLLLPNASLFAVAYMLGPGFAFGADTLVATSGVTLGRMPAFPLLSALPSQGAVPTWATALVAVPVLAGVLAGLVAVRGHPVPGLDRAALRGSLGGLLAGLVAGALTGLAGGSIGPGRMSETGAAMLECVTSGGAAMALGGAVGGVLACWRARRRQRSLPEGR